MAERGTFNVSRVYVIACEGSPPLKIGIAKNCEKRLRSLQIGCPYELILVFQTNGMLKEIARQVEFKIHSLLSKQNTRGEWFEVDREAAISVIREAQKYVRTRRGKLGHSPAQKRSNSLGVL